MQENYAECIHVYIYSGAYEPPEGRKERPTPHYSVERHLNLNGRDTSLIWTYSQVGRRKERPTPHYSVEWHLNLNGRDTSLIWTYSQVGRNVVFITNALRYTPSVRVVPSAYSAGDDCKRVTRVSQFTTEIRKRTQDRKARKAASAVHVLVLPTWLQE